jgi:alkyl hydroperoxide reductase subunit AhpF
MNPSCCTRVPLVTLKTARETGTRAAAAAHTESQFDVVVYGAPAGGVLAAVAAARRGARTALLCSTWPDCYPPSLRFGGLTTVSECMSERMIDGCHGNHQRVETSRRLHAKCQLLDVVP